MPRRDDMFQVQAWLDPERESEGAVIEYVRSAQANGFAQREILVDALNARIGATPELFAESGDPQTAVMARILRRAMRTELNTHYEQLLTDFGNEVLRIVKEHGVTAFDRDDDTSDVEVTGSLANLAQSFLSRTQGGE